MMHLYAGRRSFSRSMNATSASPIPRSRYPAINRAALAACDARDGVADGVIENPGACTFNPKVLALLRDRTIGPV